MTQHFHSISGIAADTMKINGAIRQFKQVFIYIFVKKNALKAEETLSPSENSLQKIPTICSFLFLFLLAVTVHPSAANSVILAFCPLYSWSTNLTSS